MKARTFAWSFLPGEASTPLVTSTAYGRTWRTASSTLSGVSPPARMMGPSIWACAARSQSIVTPVPPGFPSMKASRTNPLTWYAAIRVRDSRDLERMAAYQVSGFVLDAFIEGKPGGTGVTIDWDLAAQAQMLGPIILAGGLTPDNVLEAVRQVRPYAVDVTSGVEASPGKKDHVKVRAFITNAKSWTW